LTSIPAGELTVRATGDSVEESKTVPFDAYSVGG